MMSAVVERTYLQLECQARPRTMKIPLIPQKRPFFADEPRSIIFSNEAKIQRFDLESVGQN